MILLTDEEIRKIYLDRAIERFGVEAGTQLISQLESINNAQAVAKVQFKKLVEWLRDRNKGYIVRNLIKGTTEYGLQLTPDDWQALLEEVEK